MPMMSERDNVAHIKTSQLDGDRLFFQMVSVDHADYPTNPNIVRLY